MHREDIQPGHRLYDITRKITATVDAKLPAGAYESDITYVRRARDSLLKACDWTQMSDNGLTDAKRSEWATYRQALRDITNTTPIVWPTQPN
jgi:hypothetical protein